MSFRNTVLKRIQENAVKAQEDRDQAWHEWRDTTHGTYTALKELAFNIPPSQRTHDEYLRAIVYKVNNKEGI